MKQSDATTGVLLTAFGGPSCLDDIEPFMCSLMGREPSAEEVESARIRYLTIGGASPLPIMADRIAAALERRFAGLEDAAESSMDESAGFGMIARESTRATEGVTTRVLVGMRYCEPTIATAVDDLVAGGVTRIVTVSLSPFEAAITTGAYREALEEAVGRHPGVEIVEAPSYRDDEAYVRLLSDMCTTAMWELPEEMSKLVMFTAHSLPVDELADDPYVEQLHRTVAAVALDAGLGEPGPGLPGVLGQVVDFGGPGEKVPWVLAYQSKGRKPGEWLGPDINDAIAAAAQVTQSVAVCPVGFAIDHLETLYDLDVVAHEEVLEAGLEFARARVPNDQKVMIDVLQAAIEAVL